MASTSYPRRVEEDAELLTPASVRRLLDQHGLAPRRSAGQNFVVDPNTVRKIVRDAHVGRDDVVLEIGPGLGSLTVALADVARHVIAVEIDSGLVAALREVVGERDDVEIVHADALAIDLDDLVDGGPARLIANLPYNVATPIVMQALGGEAIVDLHVMVQKEVGERWSAAPGHPLYSGVSARIGLLAEVEVVADVPRTVFHPVPNVDSVTVRLTRRPDALAGDERELVFRLIDAAFRMRRKTLRNSLGAEVESTALAAAFAATGIDPGQRPEALDGEDFRRLAEALTEHTAAR